MILDTDTQKIVDDYVEALHEREPELTAFHNSVQGILGLAKKRMDNTIAALDKKFQEEDLSEEAYLTEVKTTKASIVSETKQALEELVASLEK